MRPRVAVLGPVALHCVASVAWYLNALGVEPAALSTSQLPSTGIVTSFVPQLTSLKMSIDAFVHVEPARSHEHAEHWSVGASPTTTGDVPQPAGHDCEPALTMHCAKPAGTAVPPQKSSSHVVGTPHA